MKNWKKIDKDTPRDKYILLYKKARDGKKMIVIGELTEYKGKTHHLWSGMYSDTVELWKNWISPRWNGKFTHWQPLED